MDRECSNCGFYQVLDELFDTDNELPVSYYQWRTPANGRRKKLLVVSNVVEAKEDLKAQLAPFGRHVYNFCRQFHKLRHLKDCLPAGEVIIHEDFAENFSLNIKVKSWLHSSRTKVSQFLQLLHTSETQKRELSSMLLLLSLVMRQKHHLYI